ncbi:MAG TPA: TlpA disulfide reductase family protein [Gemmatimonadaceae bacterium]|nr:TlpA disulfide reductase family protein [Gemmatimonadaceae bacterium]
MVLNFGVWIRGAAALVVTALVLGTPLAASAQLDVGTKAPAAAVTTLDGAAIDLSSFIGDKPVLLEFWATWCPQCKALEPKLEAAARKYGDRVHFVAVAVSVNQSPARVKAYAERHAIPMTFVFDSKGNATGAYDVLATSTILVIDAKGTIVYTGSGGDQDIEAALSKAF